MLLFFGFLAIGIGASIAHDELMDKLYDIESRMKSPIDFYDGPYESPFSVKPYDNEERTNEP